MAWGRDINYIVQPGDNPWNITQRYLRSMNHWPGLQTRNSITDPYHILPGTVLRIPAAWFALRSAMVKVLGIEGAVSVVDRHGDRHELKTSDALQAGSTIHTGDQASLTLGLADASHVLIRGESEVQVLRNRHHPYGSARDIRLELREGYLENEVASRKTAGGRFEIRTPAMVAAVRGTRFRIAIQGDRTITEVVEGAVQATTKTRRIDLAGGYGAVFEANRTSAPRALLAAPPTADLPPLIERMPAQHAIEPIDGAVAYRTLVSSAAGFEAVISDQRTALPVMRVRDIPDGEYFVRVRGIDSTGIEGLDGERKITVNARPEPPFLVSPEADAQLSAAAPDFHWTRRVEGATYRFQLAHDPQFIDLAIDQDGLETNGFTPHEALPPGPYYWRVLAVAPGEGPGPFGEAQSLRRLPDAPTMEATRPGDRPSLRWLGGGPGDRYRLQLAGDAAFSNLLVDTELERAEYALEGLSPGTYNARVRTLAADGYASPWGEIQEIELPSEHDWDWLLLFVPVLVGL
jgi:hypothetical protein